MKGEDLAKLTLQELFERWPETAVIFQQHQMACVGCAVAPFYSVVDAAQVYGFAPDDFMHELLLVIQNGA